jgi:hypothetical protein
MFTSLTGGLMLAGITVWSVGQLAGKAFWTALSCMQCVCRRQQELAANSEGFESHVERKSSLRECWHGTLSQRALPFNMTQ